MFKIFVGKYNSFCADHLIEPEDHEIVSITTRVRSVRILYWNLTAIPIIGFSIKVRFPWLYKQNILKVLQVALETKHQKTQTSSATRCHNHYHNQTIIHSIIIIIVIIMCGTIAKHLSTSLCHMPKSKPKSWIQDFGKLKSWKNPTSWTQAKCWVQDFGKLKSWI